jgi:hypothetical protein
VVALLVQQIDHTLFAIFEFSLATKNFSRIALPVRYELIEKV